MTDKARFRFSRLTIMVLLAAGLSPLAWAQSDSPDPEPADDAAGEQNVLPFADQIIAAYVEALGGEGAITSHSTIHATGTVEDIVKGRTGALDYRNGTGNRMFMKVEFPDETLAAGCDGEISWTINPTLGPIIFGPPSERNAFNFDLHRAVHYDRHFESMESVARVTFDGKPCYKVRIFDREGRGFHQYFDVETGLKAGTERVTRLEKGDITEAEIFRSWKEFDGVKVPTRTFTRISGQGRNDELIQVVNYNTVEFDSLTDEDFALPEVVAEAAQEKQRAGD